MVISNERCEIKEPHTYHEVTISKKKVCSGMSECGLFLHDPHDMDVEINGWCPGVCGCGLRWSTHSPGDHK